MKKAETILNEFIKGSIENYSEKDRRYHTITLETVLQVIDKALKEAGSLKYSEDDLREAFYKGREQVSLPDERATTIFLRPTFNGYLRELDGKEDPMANYRKRCDSFINNKEYDLQNWESMHKLRQIQDKYKDELDKLNAPKIPNAAKILSEWVPNIDPDLKLDVIGAMNKMASEAIDMNKKR